MGSISDLLLDRHLKKQPLMDDSTKSNAIIGSKLAVPISNLVGSPIRAPFGMAAGTRPAESVRMAKRCDALKSRSLELLEVMRAQDAQTVLDTARMRSAAGREATKRIGKMVGKLTEQQTALHFKMERLLDEMMLEIGGGRDSNN